MNSLKRHWLRLGNLSFLANSPKDRETKRLCATFFYVHHGQFIDQINEELAKRGLRSITRNELHDFFVLHKFTLMHNVHSDSSIFLGTSPSDILANEKQKGTCLVSGIYMKNEEMRFGNVAMDCFANESVYIPDHQQIFVVAIDESKSEI